MPVQRGRPPLPCSTGRRCTGSIPILTPAVQSIRTARERKFTMACRPDDCPDDTSIALDLPKTYGIDDFPLIVQDRGFNPTAHFAIFPARPARFSER